jgi:DNA polymerase sigma
VQPQESRAGAIKALRRLQHALEATHTFPATSELIAAKVPIVTGTMIGGLGADVSYTDSSAAGTAAGGVLLMQRASNAMPQLRPLMMVVKAMLKQNGLNKVCCSSNVAQARATLCT